VAYFPKADVAPAVLHDTDRRTSHPELGPTSWFTVRVGERETARAAWEHAAPPAHADMLAERVAFAWHAMDAFYEEDDRILGHAADQYHRIDIRQSSRELIVRSGDQVIAESSRGGVHAPHGSTLSTFVPFSGRKVLSVAVRGPIRCHMVTDAPLFTLTRTGSAL
jgi:uncharacterized protein (DUF427 family)